MIQEPKKDGEWSKPRKQRIQRSWIQNIKDPNDRQILAILTGASEYSGYAYYGNYENLYDTVPSHYRLSGGLPRFLLPLIAKTGRSFLKPASLSDELIPFHWKEDVVWRLVIRVSRSTKQQKHYEVSGLLQRGEEQMNLTDPLLLLRDGIVFTRDYAAVLDDGHAFQWISVLRRSGSILVPENQIGDFLNHTLSQQSVPELSLPEELQYETVESVPERCLIFQSQKDKARLLARITFRYPIGETQCIVEEGDQRPGIFQLDARRYVVRDLAAEAAARQQLLEAGLKFSSPSSWNSGGWEVSPSHFPRVVRELIANGWTVEAEGKRIRNPGEVRMQVSSGIDWFELHGTIDFEGMPVKLPELLAALKRGDQILPLSDGTYGMLPETWLQKYGLISGLGEAHEDHLRFRRSQVGLLDALLASQPEAHFDETFSKARQELKRFHGIVASEPPEGFRGTLRPYQKESLGWMNFLRQFGFGGCLADDMGLGKTIMVLALLQERRLSREENGSPHPSLVIVPKSLVFNWKLEAARFTPELRVLDHTGSSRLQGTDHFDEYDLVITTYGTLRRDALLFKDTRFDYVILDEAQAIKNANTISAKAARLLQSNYRLALSGTPVENHLGELWSLFEFLNPGMLGAARVFNMTDLSARNPDEETRKILAQALRPFILRRTKGNVAKELPLKFEQTIYCELEPKQRKLYDELRDHYRRSLTAKIDEQGMSRSKIHVLEALLRLRQAACHPALIEPNRFQESSAKLEMLLPQLTAVLEEGHKVLVFSQFTSFLAILRAHLEKQRITYEYLDGKTTDRQAKVERFQNDPQCTLFLISLKAGGLGLNLTAAQYVYLLDPWWNPVAEAQAIDRAHRIGQTQRVFAYRIISRDTVEEKVLELQKTKRDLADAIINADNSLIRNLEREDLELLLS